MKLETLEKYYNDGLLHKQTHPTLDLTIWNYSPRVQYEKLWDDVTIQCRGLVTNSKGDIVARPFKKFFNYEEHKPEDLPNETFEVYEKMDGSLGILFYYEYELSDEKRYNIWFNNNYETGMERFFDPKNLPDFDNPYYTPTPKRTISLMWNQRSVDTFLGLPFNIASYALLLEIIAKEVDMIPDELIGNLGDVHLYSNHIEQAKEQIGRTLTFDERYALYTGNDKTWEEDGGNSYGKINGLDMMDDRGIPTRTREPYPLPSVKITHREWYQHEKVKEHLGEKTFNEKILALRPDCFELLNYKSHPPIKAPLSN